MAKAIRNAYSEQGVKAYYLENGAQYSNPHFLEIRTLLKQNETRIDYSQVLDFCCGSGEVSLVLQEMDFPLPSASDPYTQKAYEANFARSCQSYSFEDIIRGQLEGQFSAIICSFAMHLCPEKQLYPLVFQLFQHTSQLVILTPHKRPALEALDGVQLDFEDFTLTERGKQVRLKSYKFQVISS